MKKYRKNRDNSQINAYPLIGSASFGGKKKEVGCSLSLSRLPKVFLHVGELVELECETPLEDNCDSFGLIKSRGKPMVSASEDGKYVMIVSSDKKKGEIDLNPESPILKDASKLYTAFHGTDVDKVLKIGTAETKVLVFWGHLNHVVYSVPSSSERRGVPFIHEAKDRGDDTPPAEEKPIVCVSPNRDFLIMYGPQFVFTERGMIG